MKRALFIVAASAIFLAGFGLAYALQPQPDQDKHGQRESLDIRYAQAQVALAETNLRRLQDMNAKVKNSVSGDLIVSTTQDLAIAQLDLQAARAGGGDFNVWLERAAADWKYADALYQGAAAADKHVPGTINPIDLERRRLRAQVAQLQYERGESAKGTPALEETWRLSLIASEIQTLKDEVRQTVPSTPIYPYWRW